MKKIIQEFITETLNKLGFSGVEFSVDEPPDLNMGDYASNIALKAAGLAKKSPRQFAEELSQQFSQNKLFASVQVQGPGFINFKLSKEALAKTVTQILKQGAKHGSSKDGKGEKILLEYFQPNIAKPLHLGHLRTAIIGDALLKVLNFTGYRVKSDTHIGDWGTQFGLLLYAYKKWGDDKVIKANPIEELNKLYIRVNEEMGNDPAIREAGKAEFVKLEKGDKQNRKLWNLFSRWSWKEFKKVYSLLGIRKHDFNLGESFYEDKMQAVLAQLKKKELLTLSQGAQIVDLQGYNLGVAIIVKSDGGTTYLLRDLATFIFRKSKGFAKQLYVVDVRQEHTFRQTFKILRLLGEITKDETASHISYGFLSTKEGIFSTRKGNSVGPVELLQETEKKVLEIIKEKNSDLKSKEKVAHQVAVGAIKYFDLSHNRHSDIVFEWDKVLNFDGNSGPYLQYTHARIKSILRKAKAKVKNGELAEKLSLAEERAILVRLQRFAEVVSLAAESYMLHYIAEYLYKLSQEFNLFYQKIRVLDEKDEEVRMARLVLISAVAVVLKNGLDLLGIEAPDQM